MLLTLVAFARASTWTVDPAGGGDYTTIRSALSGAAAGDTIQVVAGTYTETVNLNKAVSIVGTDGAGATLLAPRGTVGFVVSADATIEGFTVTAPSATAIEVTAGAPTIRGVVVSGSGDATSASSLNAVRVAGGSPTFEDTTFRGNAGYYGGHVTIEGGEATFEGCTFEDGSASQGGAMNLGVGLTATIRSSSFLRNASMSYAGAIQAGTTSTLLIEGSTFTENASSYGNGGALSLRAGNHTTIVDTTFTGNAPARWETYGFDGGAIYAQLATVDLTAVVFEGNAGSAGGAIYAESSDLRLSDTRFAGGSAVQGGAIAAVGTTITEFGTEFEGNVATEDGGALYVTGVALTLDASAFTANEAGRDGGAVYVAPQGGAVTLESVAFDTNRAGRDGGAVASTGAVLLLDRVHLDGNVAAAGGGGVASVGDTSVTLQGCELRGNLADLGGAVAVDGAGPFEDESSTWADNTADTSGGALWARGAAVWLDGADLARNTAFFGEGGSLAVEGGAVTLVGARLDAGLASGDGGHIHALGAPVSLTDSVLVDGVSVWGEGGDVWADAGVSASRVLLSGAAARGGAARLVGGLAGDTWANVAVVESTGGAVVLDGHPGIRFANLDLLGNDAGFAATDSTVDIRSTLLAWTAGTAIDLTRCTSSGGWNLLYLNGANVGGDLVAAPGDWNLEADPRLVSFVVDGDPEADVLVPLAYSPLIDAGDLSVQDPDGSRSDIGVTGGSGAAWVDADGDGVPSGLDCDDGDRDAWPGATEAGYDGVDQDCDGFDYDADHDGHDAVAWGGDDCDDADPWVFDACGDTGAPDDTGGPDDGVDVPGTGVALQDECGCDRGTGVPWGLVLGVGAGLAGRRRRAR